MKERAFKVCQKHDGNDSRIELVEMAVIALAFGMSRFVVLFVFVVPLLLVVRCSRA